MILVIFALWVLVVEPTFRAIEQVEQQSAKREPSRGEGCQDVDQPVPPGEVMSPRWVNEHISVGTAVSPPALVDLAALLHRLMPAVSPVPVYAEPRLPCPSSALPLRL